MRLVALTEGPDHVCYRYRIKAFARAFAARGFELEEVPLARSLWARLGQLRACRSAAAVFLQRKLLPLWQLRILRRAARSLIYDVDDAVFGRDSYHPKGHESWSRLTRFWATIYAADAVTAGNDYLAARAARYASAGRVARVPTCVNPEHYPLANHPGAGQRARLIWIGQGSTLPSLRALSSHLATAAARWPKLELRIVCNQFPQLPAVRVIPRLWSQETEAVELAQADIGISWLPDDPWSQGKCGLKVLQYMAAGLPVVANPIAMNKELVQHGSTGLLAETPEQWAAAIERLANDPGLRARMGEAGRQRVVAEFSVGAWGERLAEIVQRTSTAAGRQQAA